MFVYIISHICLFFISNFFSFSCIIQNIIFEVHVQTIKKKSNKYLHIIDYQYHIFMLCLYQVINFADQIS